MLSNHHTDRRNHTHNRNLIRLRLLIHLRHLTRSRLLINHNFELRGQNSMNRLFFQSNTNIQRSHSFAFYQTWWSINNGPLYNEDLWIRNKIFSLLNFSECNQLLFDVLSFQACEANIKSMIGIKSMFDHMENQF